MFIEELRKMPIIMSSDKRELEATRKKCEYCNENNDGFEQLNDTVEYSGLEISISSKGMLRVRDYNFKEIFEKQDAININYCPMCGRKLV